jgi:hypothetical protein
MYVSVCPNPLANSLSTTLSSHHSLLPLSPTTLFPADVYRHGTDPEQWPNVVLNGFKDIAGDLIESSLLEVCLCVWGVGVCMYLCMYVCV